MAREKYPSAQRRFGARPEITEVARTSAPASMALGTGGEATRELQFLGGPRQVSRRPDRRLGQDAELVGTRRAEPRSLPLQHLQRGRVRDPRGRLRLAQHDRLTNRVESAGGGSRTHTGVPPRRILSPLRLPFRHAGLSLVATR